MKTPITTLEDALSLELGVLYDGEEELNAKLQELLSSLSDGSLKSACEKYADSTAYKRVKIKRMFTYIAQESRNREDGVMQQFLNDMDYIVKHTQPDSTRAFLLTRTLLKVNQYKIDSYRTAQMIAMKLEWEVVTDLLSTIIEWELKTNNELIAISRKMFTRETIFI